MKNKSLGGNAKHVNTRLSIRNPMFYPFELRAPGSGNSNYDKGFRLGRRMGNDLLKCLHSLVSHSHFKAASEPARYGKCV